MNKNKFELVDIAKAGASLVLDASKYNKFELVEIAQSISSGCTLHLTNCSSKTKFELIDIVEAAPQRVTLQ
ncbi:TPA: hypothetical protein GRR71_16050 [Vibrio parahaemolyticus]|nr:hypothetical protein [Vibrio parahaemolyticus]EJK2407325.1 hypothetical protein [Vibrio parahaemolyticus]ELI5445802.1 hypothetical protein [Vibrio parahaemolyticus]HAS6448102.1 hypothetical protein [Vibrio parahaemolyticus]